MFKKSLLVAAIAASSWVSSLTSVNADDCRRGGGYSSYRPPVHNHGHSHYSSGYRGSYSSYRPPVGIPGGYPFGNVPFGGAGYGVGYGSGFNSGFNSGLGNTWGGYGAGGYPRNGAYGAGGFGPGFSLYIGR